jgi:hypothetical protein
MKLQKHRRVIKEIPEGLSSSLANTRATASVKYFVLLPSIFLDSMPLLYRNWDLIPPAMIVSLDMA